MVQGLRLGPVVETKNKQNKNRKPKQIQFLSQLFAFKLFLLIFIALIAEKSKFLKNEKS
jgi:hypothetical protein